jgi:FdhD protein
MGAEQWPVFRYQGDHFEAMEKAVVEESPLTLHVNDQEVLTLLTLGEHPLELALGFMRSEGFFSAREELLGWREEPGNVWVEVARDIEAIQRLLEKRTVTTGCGKGTTFYSALDALRCRPLASQVQFTPRTILRQMNELHRRSGLYRETGGTHNASLSDGEQTLCFRTDIGRHNAVDMIGGRAFLDGLDLSSTLLLTTGRISSEILIKTAKMGVPFIASRSAPTALALRLADEVRVTVVGYIRNGRFNVYTHPERVEGTPQAALGFGGVNG